MAALKLLPPENSSDPNKEVVRIQVLKDTNLKLYAIVDHTFDSDGNETDIFRHIYRFPDWPVKSGEYVRLYSGKGTNFTTPKNGDKATTHQLYWGSASCIWNNDGDIVSLIRYKVVEKQKMPAVEKIAKK